VNTNDNPISLVVFLVGDLEDAD